MRGDARALAAVMTSSWGSRRYTSPGHRPWRSGGGGGDSGDDDDDDEGGADGLDGVETICAGDDAT
jgi:hypothetical protein